MNATGRPIWKGVVAGALGGLAGSLMMNQFQSLWSKASEALSPKKPEEDSQSKSQDDDATVKTAQAISETVADHGLTEDEKKWAGPLVHYSTGALFGSLYGGVSEVAPAATIGRGAVFGAAVWLVADEIGVPAAGLSAPPTETPASSHINALASHLVYGFTTDFLRRLLLKALD